MRHLGKAFVTAACIALFSCHGADRIPASYFGIYKSHFGETIEISNYQIRVSGFSEIGAHDQTLDSAFEGFSELSDAMWNQQPGIYIEPVLTSATWYPDGAYDEFTPEQSLLLSFSVGPDDCQKDHLNHYRYSDKVFSIYLVTDMDLHLSEGQSDSDRYKSMSGDGSVVAFNIDTTLQEPVSQLKVYARRSNVISTMASDRCGSLVRPGYFLDEYPTYLHRVK